MILKFNFGNGRMKCYETDSFYSMIEGNNFIFELSNNQLVTIDENCEIYVMENGKTVDRYVHIIPKDN